MTDPVRRKPGFASVVDKFAETVSVFTESRPSLRRLWRSRRNRDFVRAHVILPSTAVVGESLSATVQAWDPYERLAEDFDGALGVETTDPAATTPGSVTFERDAGGVTTLEGISFETPGTHYLVLHYDGERFVSNPVRVHAEPPETRVYWGDIHLHSQFSDGAGSMGKGMAFGRDVMDLDVVAYTDHDTMGFFIPPQWQRKRMHREYFDAARERAERFNDPGEFVTLFGYEWTKQPNMGGHVNVYFDRAAGMPLFDSLARDTHTYEDLWARLREWRDGNGGAGDVVTIPHHSAEAMYPFDFSAIDYDDDLAPLVEVYSQWGNSERPGDEGNPRPLAMGQGEVGEDGHYVRDAHALGYRAGMLASSDFHGPHPGHSLIHAPSHLPRLSELREDGLGWGHIWRVWNERSYPGGLVAFRAPELTREAIFDALRSRRVYGTSQPHRILVDFAIDGTRVGEADSTVTVPDATTPREVTVDVAGTGPLASVTVVKNDAELYRWSGTEDVDADLDTYTTTFSVTDDAPVAGLSYDGERGTDADVYYVRVRQAGAHDTHYPTDGRPPAGMAWAGPIWVGVEE